MQEALLGKDLTLCAMDVSLCIWTNTEGFEWQAPTVFLRSLKDGGLEFQTPSLPPTIRLGRGRVKPRKLN